MSGEGSPPSYGRKALGGASSTVFWQGLRLGLLALSIVVLARLLSPSDYGLLAMVTAIIGVGELLRDLGLSVAAIQSKTLSSAEKTNLFWVNSAIGLLLSVLVFFLSWPIAAIYGEPELVFITQALSVTFLINGVATQFKAQITRDMRFWTLGFAETLPQALGLAVAIWLGVAFASYWSLVAQALVIALVGLIMDVVLARWSPGLPDRTISIRRFLSFGGALTGTQSLAYLSKNIDTVLLGLFYGSASLGFYNRAYQLVVLPLTQLTAPLSRVAIPLLSRMQDDTKNYLRYLRSGQFFTVTVSSLFYGFLVGLAEPLVLILLGPKWTSVAPILQALAISGIFRAMGQVPYWIFLTKGLAGKQFRFYLVAQPLIVVAIVCGLPWGPVGVAIGCSVGYALFWSLQMWWAGRSSGINTAKLAWSGLSLAALVSIPTAGLGILLSSLLQDAWLSTIATIGATVVYMAILMVVAPSYRSQLTVVLNLMRRRR